MIAPFLEVSSPVSTSQTSSTSPVSSFNEWDPLEEIVVGIMDFATIPSLHPTVAATMPDEFYSLFSQYGGKSFETVCQELCELAAQELEGLVNILENHGVIVRRPTPWNHERTYATPEWSSKGGSYATMPRDSLIVFGDEILEVPMSWRSRYYETASMRPLLKEYSRQGARWTSAPKPLLSDELYDPDYKANGRPWVLTEHEPVFDAADIIRCGEDIFIQASHVTNNFGIQWLQKHLEGRFRVHEIAFDDPTAMHIDVNFLPLCPGKALANPERVKEVPAAFKDWQIIYAPPSTIPDSLTLYMSSKWVSMNILMLDENTVIAEYHETPLIELLRREGFEVIPCKFRNFCAFGGSFHCATLDVRRRGTKQTVVSL
jgi:glycine amidinotransferase